MESPTLTKKAVQLLAHTTYIHPSSLSREKIIMGQMSHFILP